MCIVGVFLVCHIPRVVLNIQELLMLEDLLQCLGELFAPPAWFLCLTSFNHLLLGINSSVNFLIYCSLGNRLFVRLNFILS